MPTQYTDNSIGRYLLRNALLSWVAWTLTHSRESMGCHAFLPSTGSDVSGTQQWPCAGVVLVARATTSDDQLPPATARQRVSEGMEAFRSGQVERSIELFDDAESIQGPGLSPFLWQRGISYYYANRFEDASQQFRLDVRVNPSDVEEIVWDIASQLRSHPENFPVTNQLGLPSNRKDSRRIMPTVYKLFRGEGTEHSLALAGTSLGAGTADEFYALFYLGLYCEVRREKSKARAYMLSATQTDYALGKGRGDYMTSCARVHCYLRDWKLDSYNS